MKLINPIQLHSERYLEEVYLRDLLERKYGDSGWNISAPWEQMIDLEIPKIYIWIVIN